MHLSQRNFPKVQRTPLGLELLEFTTDILTTNLLIMPKLFVLCCLLLLSGCLFKRPQWKQPIDTEGQVFELQPPTMDRDAVRLKGKIVSEGRPLPRGRRQYQFKVIELVKYGATFSTVTPEKGEEVLLITTDKVKFRKNSLVTLDALTPISREEGTLTIDMIEN